MKREDRPITLSADLFRALVAEAERRADYLDSLYDHPDYDPAETATEAEEIRAMIAAAMGRPLGNGE